MEEAGRYGEHCEKERERERERKKKRKSV